MYAATQVSQERVVALKVSSADAIAVDSVRERVCRSARPASALGNAHIIPLFEAGEAGGSMFVAMRFVDGPTLADRMARGDLTGHEVLDILTPSAAALDAAHAARLVHGDIKPSNVLLASDGSPYLTDFGMTTGGSQRRRSRGRMPRPSRSRARR